MKLHLGGFEQSLALHLQRGLTGDFPAIVFLPGGKEEPGRLAGREQRYLELPEIEEWD